MTARLPLLTLALSLIAALGACTTVPSPEASPVSPSTTTGFPIADVTLPSLAPMLETVTPAVVNIATESTVTLGRNPLLEDPFFQRFFNLPDNIPEERRVQSLGSGVVVDAEQGYVVTNHHVIDQAEAITITLNDGRSFEAQVVGSDPATDVAVIRIDADNLTAVGLADSDQLRVGDFVVAIGNPFGLGQAVTSGIISALGRSGLGLEGYEDFIQTDAAINVGNSGGALVNLRGELIGINTAIFAPGGGNIGIGFAIPANMVRQLMAQLVAYGEVRRGQIGVRVRNLNADLAEAFGLRTNRGAVVEEVVANSMAFQAGLQAGDVITAVNGRDIDNSQDLRNVIGLLEVGDQVRLNVLRNGQPLLLIVTVGALTTAQTVTPETTTAP